MPEFFESVTTTLELRGGRRSVPGRTKKSYRGEKVVGHAMVLDDYFTRDVLSKIGWNLSDLGYARGVIPGSGNTKLHQMIFRHYKGDVPDGQVIDHIDRNKMNCLPDNLRLVSKSVNGANRKINKNNTTGYRGVNYHPECRFRGTVQVQREQFSKAGFKTAEDAARWVNEMYRKHYPGVDVPNPGVS